MNITTIRNIGALLRTVIASAPAAITAGGAGDNVAVTGLKIDRLDPNNGALAHSAQLSILFAATLAQAATLSLGTLKVEDSADGVNWNATAFATFTDPGVVATGPNGGGAVDGQASVNVELSGAQRFVRFDWTPNLSAANTDVATLLGAAVLGGFDKLPA